jgi:hypothetical protein
MPSVSITISDGLAAKIDQEFGSTALWKDWVKAQTRSHIVEQRKRAAYERRMADFEADVEQIVAADVE